MSYRIAVAELGSQGEGSPDVVSIGGQVATIRAKVQHLADNTGKHKPNRVFDRIPAAGVRLVRMVRWPM